MRKYLVLALKGFCMGAADVVPGVSGGTMAFILGIYEELIDAIRSVNLVFFRRLIAFRFKEAFADVPIGFLLALLTGIFTAVFTLAQLIKWLLENKPVLIAAFFFGLIMASIFTVYKRVDRWNAGLIAAAFLGVVGAYFLVGLVPMKTPDAAWFLFLAGAVAICAMILPGISGAFLLLILGKYNLAITAVHERDVVTLGILAAGAVVGLLLFSRLLGWLLDRRRDLTIAVLCGLMVGSLRKIWPWKEGAANVLPSTFSGETMAAILLALVGIALVLLLDRLGSQER